MGKTVAARAAELGTDKKELVRALKVLSRYRTVNDKPREVRDRHYDGWRYSYYLYPKKSLLSHEEACKFLGLDPEDAEHELSLTYPIPWSVNRIIDGLFAFMETEGRMPHSKELRNKNGLPSPGMFRWQARNAQSRAVSTRVSPLDWYETQMAADGRCTAEMAFQFRNVLARKIALDRIGFANLVKQGVATLIEEDAEFGALYRLPGEMPAEDMVLLKVINSTPEEDGSFADYYLRVPPQMTDVRQALRWTFDGNGALGKLPYAPLVET